MKILWTCAALTALLLAPQSSNAAAYSFTGVFQHDTDVQFFNFTLAQDTPGVALRTWSYTGGQNAAGQTIPGGGFEPYLSLYLADGSAMNPGFIDNCAANGLAQDPITYGCDVYYPTTRSFPGGLWAAGTYTVALSLDANPGIGNLSDGFFAPVVLGLTPPANFTCESQGNPPSVPVDAPFCSSLAPGIQRTGFWALDILNVDSASGPPAPVPEPAPFALVACGMAALAGKRLRARART